MLIDELLDRTRYRDSEGRRKMHEWFTHPKLVSIDAEGVCAYAERLVAEELKFLDPEFMHRHCTDLRMPSPVVWIEYPADVPGESRKLGHFIRFGPLNEDLFADVIHRVASPVSNEYGQEMRAALANQKPVFELLIDTFGRRCGEITPFPWLSLVYLDSEGRMVNLGTDRCVNFCIPICSGEDASAFLGLPKEEALAEISIACHNFIIIPLITLSLLNVKNVGLRAHRPDEKIQKKRVKNGKRPLVTSYTLEITAPGKRFVGGNKSTTNGTGSRPLHLVRGHLADYRDGNGLFGKYKGVYWMPAHFRGSDENGVINKRYRVKTDV